MSTPLWDDNRIKKMMRGRRGVDAWHDHTPPDGRISGVIRSSLVFAVAHQMRDSYEQHIAAQAATIAELEDELAGVLDVTMARGVQLGYEDKDFHARYVALTGEEWQDEWEDNDDGDE